MNARKRKMAQRMMKQWKRMGMNVDHLEAGKSEKTISRNIATEVKSGKSPKQAEAIAYSVAGKDDKGFDNLMGLYKSMKGQHAQDADKWITVKPNGPDHKGRHVEIDGQGRVVKGMGGKFTGEKVTETSKKFVGPKTPKDITDPDAPVSYEGKPNLQEAANEVARSGWEQHGQNMSRGDFKRAVRGGHMHHLVQKKAQEIAKTKEEKQNSIKTGIEAAEKADLPSGYSVKPEGDKLIVSGQFDPDINKKLKRLGGHWDGIADNNRKVWIVPAESGKSFPRIFKNAKKAVSERQSTQHKKDINRFTGYVNEAVKNGYLYHKGISRLEDLASEADPETKEKINQTIQAAKSQVQEHQKKQQEQKRQAKEAAQQRSKEALKEYNSTPISERTYLNVPYSEKDTAKRHGAKWDPQRRSWYHPGGEFPEELEKYSPAEKGRAVRRPPTTGRIDENDPSIWGHELLGHEGERWDQFLASEAGHDFQVRNGLKPKDEEYPQTKSRHWGYSDEAVERALRGEDSADFGSDDPDDPNNYDLMEPEPMESPSLDDLMAQYAALKGTQDESGRTKEHDEGKLSEKEEATASERKEHRDDMPESAFLEPESRKYPVKTEKDNAWHYDRNLLLAAAREARMHGHEELANRADEIRDREFGSEAKDEAPVAAGILYLNDGKALLLKRGTETPDYPGHWGFPAGHIEDGESPLLAALRESKEEVGFAPDSAQFLSDQGGFHLFVCRNADFTPVLNDESMGYIWADTDDLPQPLHPGIQEAIDAAQVAGAMDKRDFDANGWFEVKDNPLSKVGVFPYRGSQLKGAPDPNKTYNVLRPADELGSRETMESFKLLPWINDHVMLGPEDQGLTPAERKGVGGVIGADVYFKDGILYGNIKVFSQSMADAIKHGKTQLSCGYRCDYDWTPGTWKGQPYDCIQTHILGNHLALVQEGRMGPEVAVLDHKDDGRFILTCDSKLEHYPMAEPSINSPEQGNEASGMTLEDAREQFNTIVEQLDQIMPMLAKLKPMLAEGEDEEGDPEEKGVIKEGDEPEGKPEGEDMEKPDEEAKAAEEAGRKAAAEKEEEGKGMDEADLFRKFQAQMVARDKLASRLAPHVGTFDHSLMDENQVAHYGCKKLGLNAPKGHEKAFLDGYLSAAVKRESPKAVAQDNKGGNWLDQQRASLKH